MMRKVELEVKEILNRLSSEMFFILLLKEKDGNRSIPILVGLLEAQAIAIKLRDLKVPRPTIYDLFLNTSKMFDAFLKEVLIYKIEGGLFYSYLTFDKDGGEIQVDSRTSDAVALAMRAGVPIHIHEDLLEKHASRDEGGGAYSMPITTASLEILREALSKSIEAENYELAAQIRDEIKKRINEI
jgi:bifunctional DNase/RNase